MISLRYQQWTFLLNKEEKEQIQSNFKGSIVICSCKPPTTVTGLVFFNAMRSTPTKKLRPLKKFKESEWKESWQKISLTNQPTLDFWINIQVMVTKGPFISLLNNSNHQIVISPLFNMILWIFSWIFAWVYPKISACCSLRNLG